MKKFFSILILTCFAVFAFAQNSSLLRPRMEIAEVEVEVSEDIATELEVFYMNDETPRTYYLSLGHLGIGGDIVQIDFDPLFELFIPLGGTLEESIAKMQEISEFYKMPKLSTMELSGCFAVAYPNAELIPVQVTRRQLILTRLLEFSIPVPGNVDLVRATHISKGDFVSLLNALKFYRKLHPGEE